MKKIAMFGLSCVLLACGGGGSSPTSIPATVTAPATINVAAALRNIASSAGNYWSSPLIGTDAVHGVVNFINYSTNSIFNAPDGTKISNVQVLIVQIARFRVGTSEARKRVYLVFDKDATKLVGFWWARESPSGYGASYCAYNPNITVPATSASGASGVLVNGPAYSGELSCPGGVAQWPNARLLWSLEDISSAHNFCFALEDGIKFNDFKLCFPVSSDGTIDKTALTLISDGYTFNN